jgi:hypothetical protein
MAKKKSEKGERLNLTLTVKETKKLNDYCISLVNKKGRIPSAIKTKIAHKALAEWLEKHAEDFDIEFAPY